MGDLMKTVAKFGFWALAFLIVGWTMMHTYDVLYKTNPIKENQILAIYGLLVFEVGAIIWFAAFLKNAEGLGQHVISLFGAVLGLALVSVAFILDYMTPPEELIAYSSMARWAVIVATVADLFFVFMYELFNPKVWEDLQENINIAVLHAKADKKAQGLIERDSDALAEEIAKNRKERAFAAARLQGIKSIPSASPDHPMHLPAAPPMRSLASDVKSVDPRDNGHSSPNP